MGLCRSLVLAYLDIFVRLALSLSLASSQLSALSSRPGVSPVTPSGRVYPHRAPVTNSMGGGTRAVYSAHCVIYPPTVPYVLSCHALRLLLCVYTQRSEGHSLVSCCVRAVSPSPGLRARLRCAPERRRPLHARRPLSPLRRKRRRSLPDSHRHSSAVCGCARRAVF